MVNQINWNQLKYKQISIHLVSIFLFVYNNQPHKKKNKNTEPKIFHNTNDVAISVYTLSSILTWL